MMFLHCSCTWTEIRCVSALRKHDQLIKVRLRASKYVVLNKILYVVHLNSPEKMCKLLHLNSVEIKGHERNVWCYYYY